VALFSKTMLASLIPEHPKQLGQKIWAVDEGIVPAVSTGVRLCPPVSRFRGVGARVV